jgi:hypothetical protein
MLYVVFGIRICKGWYDLAFKAVQRLAAFRGSQDSGSSLPWISTMTGAVMIYCTSICVYEVYKLLRRIHIERIAQVFFHLGVHFLIK